MQENIIAGLVSGLVVTLFVVVFKKLWDAVIVPWFEDKVYKDVRIEGKWYGLYPNTVDLSQDIVVLEREGHAIKGKLTRTKGHDEGNEFILQGSFRNMILPITYEINDKQKTDRGTITLKAIKNGEEMVGKIALYNNMEDQITTAAIHWFRSKDVLEQKVEKISKIKDRIKALEARKREIERQESMIGEEIEIKGDNKSVQSIVETDGD